MIVLLFLTSRKEVGKLNPAQVREYTDLLSVLLRGNSFCICHLPRRRMMLFAFLPERQKNILYIM